MTVTEFKQKYPHYAHLKGEALWNKMEDVLLKEGTCWDADYSEGEIEEYKHKDAEGYEIIWNAPKYWINRNTGQRITHEEKKKLEKPYGFDRPLSSLKFDILDFS